MSAKHLLILITRVVGRDEWETVWRFPAGDFMAFIYPGKVIRVNFEQFRNLDLSTHLDADVWVIHGKDYYQVGRRNALHAALNAFDWKQRNVTLKIHRGGARFVESQDFKDQIDKIECEHTKALLKQAQNYGLGDTDRPDHPIVRFAQATSEPFRETEYIESLEALTAKSPLHMRIADTMHHLGYVLHPLDIDVQGLLVTDFELDYWNEVSDVYKNGKALLKLTQTRELIHNKQGGSTDDTAESVIREAEQRFGQEGIWSTSWHTLQQYVPGDEGPGNIEAILALMQDSSAGNLEKIRKYFRKGENPIHEWVTNINRTLGEIRDALSAREKGIKPEQSK